MFLTDARIYPLSPEIKTTALQCLAHQGYNLRFTQTKLCFDGVKTGSVFPGHFYDSVRVHIERLKHPSLVVVLKKVIHFHNNYSVLMSYHQTMASNEF
jgi:hypothetical protein